MSAGSVLYIIATTVLGLVADRIVVANRLIIIVGMITSAVAFFTAGITLNHG